MYLLHFYIECYWPFFLFMLSICCCWRNAFEGATTSMLWCWDWLVLVSFTSCLCLFCCCCHMLYHPYAIVLPFRVLITSIGCDLLLWACQYCPVNGIPCWFSKPVNFLSILLLQMVSSMSVWRIQQILIWFCIPEMDWIIWLHIFLYMLFGIVVGLATTLTTIAEMFLRSCENDGMRLCSTWALNLPQNLPWTGFRGDQLCWLNLFWYLF